MASLRLQGFDVLLTMDPRPGDPLGRVDDGVVVVDGDTIAWVGPRAEAPDAEHVLDVHGGLGLPGLIDCHTHSLFAGSRADEFRRRLGGASYSEILEAGGGILSTVAATRAASDGALRDSLRQRLAAMAAGGVTTVEVKTGYALSVDEEARCLGLLGEGWPTEVIRTFLGAHTVPAEWRPDRAGYVEHLLDEMLPVCAPLADCVDVYCDRGAFTVEETERILRTGMALGLTGRVHAEQVAHTGAAALAGRLGCASADHLERLDEEGAHAMGQGGTVAVLLPGAMLYLKDPPPPVPLLREHGVPMAVATDFNPGSSPVRDLLGCATLACLTMGLTVEEALAGVTRNAASALGLSDRGMLRAGLRADLAVFDPPPGEPADPAVLVQYMGGHRARLVLRGGVAA